MSSDSDAGGTQPQQTTGKWRRDTVESTLDDLATTEIGLGFIYSALEFVAEHFELSDAVVVLDDDIVGTQIFRLGGRAVGADLAAQLRVEPGVYCEPAIVSNEDLSLILASCQNALDRTRLEGALRLDPDGRRAPRTSSRVMQQLNRVIASKVLLVIDVITFALTVGDVHGPLRFFFGLILGIFIPGWSVVGLIRLRNVALEIALSTAASLTFLMLLAQILTTINLWHPIVLEEIMCVVCFPSLLFQSRADSVRSGSRR